MGMAPNVEIRVSVLQMNSMLIVAGFTDYATRVSGARVAHANEMRALTGLDVIMACGSTFDMSSSNLRSPSWTAGIKSSAMVIDLSP
jgi:hypothetical protein